jgi:serine/threonine-protein kinase
MPPRIPAPTLLGRVVCGRYRITQLLASGGIGDVYLAEPSTGPRQKEERVAVKVLRGEHLGQPEVVERFRREADAAARIRHENVMSVIEGLAEAPASEPLCYVAELLVGLDLADTLSYSGALGPPRAARIALGIASGLAAAHAAGVVHRDVKPENVFLVHAADGRETVKIIDFGLAWIAGDCPKAARRVVGTPEYMAPEQAQGAPASPPGDVYSLGVVLYEMLSGRVPFTAPYPAIARLHAEAPVPPLRARTAGASDRAPSPELEALVMRALSKARAARFATMPELLEALAETPELTRLG